MRVKKWTMALTAPARQRHLMAAPYQRQLSDWDNLDVDGHEGTLNNYC